MSNVTSSMNAKKPIEPPLKAVIIPVTPLQQNCTLFWCTETNKGALVDPGGDLDKLKAAVAKTGVQLEKLLVTHGHLDHCGQTGMLAKELGLTIEGPHEEDRFWIAQLDDDGKRWGMHAESFRAGPLAARWRHGDGRQPDARRDPLPRTHARAMWCSTTRPAASRLSAMCCFRDQSAAPISRAAIISN